MFDCSPWFSFLSSPIDLLSYCFLCMSCRFCSCFLWLSKACVRCSRPLHGNCVRYSLWFSSWAGDGKLLSTGVVRYVGSARYGSCHEASAFRSRFFTVWTDRSMNPLLYGYNSELVTWSMPHCLQKAANCWLLYWGSLSDTRVSAILCSANTDLRWFITAADVDELSFLMMGYLL